jgi:hypothetical protein
MSYRPLYDPSEGVDSTEEVRRAVARQLRERGPISDDVWGSPARTRLARRVCEWLRDFGDWPNHRFIPEDPLRLILRGEDSLDFLEVAMAFEEEFHVEATEAHPSMLADLRLSGFVDLLLQNPPARGR